MSHYNKSSDRSVPFSTSRDNSTSDYFPLSSQSPRLGNSSFNSTRNKIFNNLSEFEDQLPSNKMFVDRSPFGSSFDHPRMMSGSRNLDMSNSFRDEMDDQVNHHPRVFNIPIQVETPEGFVPFIRSNSNVGSHSNGNRGNMSQLKDPVGSDFTYGSPSERPGYIHQRPVKSPTPPPKPKFSRNRPDFHNHHQSYQQNPESYSHSHPRVHSIPVKIERSGKSQQPTRNDSPQPYDEVNHPNSPNYDTFFGGRRSRSSSESESHQPDVNRSVNIPIQIVKTQSSEPQNVSTESNQPVNPPNPPQPCENKEKTTPDPIELINEIEKEACRLEKEVIEFNGEYLDKKYRYLDEMLTRCMLKLDSIDSNGRDEVRMARRSTLAHVDHCVAILEGKVIKPKPEENLDETTNQCDEQAETATMESGTVQQVNEESISNESPACEMSEDQKNDMMETENNSDETNISAVDEQEPKSTPVIDNVNIDESTCKPDEVSFDQLDLETSSADSTRVYLDDTAHNSQSEQMSQDLEANESDNSPEPKVEFPPDDNLDELVDKESMDIEVKASPDSGALNEPEQSISSTTESLVTDEKSNNEYRVESTEVQEPDSNSSPITDNSIEKQKKID